MNTFSGSITFKGTSGVDDLEYSHIELISEGDASTTIFLFGKTSFETSEAFIGDMTQKYGALLSYDISIQTEDQISMLGGGDLEDDEGLYECVSFEGMGVEFRNIVQRFEDSFEVVAVREAEESKKYGNRVIKVDFVY